LNIKRGYKSTSIFSCFSWVWLTQESGAVKKHGSVKEIIMKLRYQIIIFLILVSAACTSGEKSMEKVMNPKTIDLSQYPSDMPRSPLNLLFIHHSCGGQLFADKGPDIGNNCIYKSHPNGGGLRKLLEENNYIVHEASYGSIVGDKTDICHWNMKFRNQMDSILSCRNQDEFFSDSTRNTIVIFKSCFPNNWIVSDGDAPGDPDSCTMTTANFKAAYSSLLPYFKKHPETLFVVMTAPPLAKPVFLKRQRLSDLLKTVLNRPDTIEKVGPRAREFNNWLKDSENGWLKGYELRNVVVFDLYDILTKQGESNWLMYPTNNGTDSHPSSQGNTLAAQEFIPFLNKSVHRFEIH